MKIGSDLWNLDLPKGFGCINEGNEVSVFDVANAVGKLSIVCFPRSDNQAVRDEDIRDFIYQNHDSRKIKLEVSTFGDFDGYEVKSAAKPGKEKDLERLWYVRAGSMVLFISYVAQNYLKKKRACETEQKNMTDKVLGSLSVVSGKNQGVQPLF